MKKFFTLISAALMASAVQAQVVFLDPEGNEYADGSSMTIKSQSDPDFPEDVYYECPIIKNKGAQAVNVSLTVNILELPENTAIADCFGGACINFDVVGSHTTIAREVPADGTLSTQVEWNSWNGVGLDTTQASIELTANVGDEKTTITVTYVYDNGGNRLNGTKTAATVVACYSILGRPTSPNTKGIVLMEMSDGTVRKVINK